MAATIGGKPVLLNERYLFKKTDTIALDSPFQMGIKVGDTTGGSTLVDKPGGFDLVVNGIGSGDEKSVNGTSSTHDGIELNWFAVVRSLTDEMYAADITIVVA